MRTYGAESFYRATIRQSISDVIATPFSLKVSKVPSLTTGLLTISPNTSNEEIIEYNGIDSIALTITVVKRGISHSTQALTTSGTDYNNTLYMKSHSQNDAIRGDVNHIHIIQDYGALDANKLNKTGGLRDGMGLLRQATEIDVTGAEVKKSITDGTTISSTETIRKRKSDGTYEEIPYSSVLSDMTTSSGSGVSITPYESSIAIGNPVGLLPDGIFKCGTQLATSTNISGSSISLLSQTTIDSTRILFLYDIGNALTGVVGSLSGDTITYGTPFTIYSAIGVRGCVAQISTGVVACAYGDIGAGSLQRVRILTITGTTITGGAEVTQSLNNGFIGNFTLSGINIIKLRSNAFVTLFMNNVSRSQIKSWTVSGTTITGGTEYANTVITGSGSWGQTSFSLAYLSDNYFSYDVYSTGQGVGAQGVQILYINPSGTNVLNTYTWNPASNYSGGYLSRLNNTTVLFTFSISGPYTTTYNYMFGISTNPTALADNLAYLPTIGIVDDIFGVLNGTNIAIYNRESLLGNITITAIPYSNTTPYINGRIVYPTGANGTIRIVKLANLFYFGISNSITGGVSVRGITTISGITMGSKYYLQSDGTISTNKTTKYVGIGVGTNLILLG